MSKALDDASGPRLRRPQRPQPKPSGRQLKEQALGRFCFGTQCFVTVKRTPRNRVFQGPANLG